MLFGLVHNSWDSYIEFSYLKAASMHSIAWAVPQRIHHKDHQMMWRSPQPPLILLLFVSPPSISHQSRLLWYLSILSITSLIFRYLPPDTCIVPPVGCSGWPILDSFSPLAQSYQSRAGIPP